MGVLIGIGILAFFLYFIFRKEETPEEKAEREKKAAQERKEATERIQKSDATLMVCNYLYNEFSDAGSERIFNLRQGLHYGISVNNKGIHISLYERGMEPLKSESLSFSTLGFEDLPYGGLTEALTTEIMNTLRTIDLIEVRPGSNTGFTVWAGKKQSW